MKFLNLHSSLLQQRTTPGFLPPIKVLTSLVPAPMIRQLKLIQRAWKIRHTTKIMMITVKITRRKLLRCPRISLMMQLIYRDPIEVPKKKSPGRGGSMLCPQCRISKRGRVGPVTRTFTFHRLTYSVSLISMMTRVVAFLV
jgi:hypothetical protein